MTKLLLAASAAFLIATPVLAEGAYSDGQSQTVSARQVDFSNPADVRHFYGRLRSAARNVCDSGSSLLELKRQDAACERDVMARAVQTTGQPLLTAMYQSSSDASTRAFAGNDQ